MVRVRVKVRVRNRIPKIAIFLEKSQKLRYALVFIELRSLLGLGLGFGFGSLGFGVRVRIGIILVYTTAWYRARRICITFIMDGLYQIFPNTQKTGMYQIFPNGGSIKKGTVKKKVPIFLLHILFSIVLKYYYSF